jgi:DNA-binding GntR family transcriptional regulator
VIRAASLMVVAAVSLAAAAYSPEKMQRMAAAQKAMSEGRAGDLATVAAAHEFKGYVAAVLDNDRQLKECTRLYDLDAIAYRASVLVAGQHDDTEVVSSVTAAAAVQFACDSFKTK